MKATIEQKASARKDLNWKSKFGGTDLEAHIGGRIRELRKAHFVSQEELATALGYESTVAISLIEQGARTIRASKLLRLAEFFGVSLSTFQI